MNRAYPSPRSAWPRACWLAAVSLCALALHPARARADGRALVETDALLAGRPYEGLLVLRGGYGNSALVDADALVWVGATEDGREGDVLVVNVRLREPHGFGEARVGRFILSTGAVRPVQIDGVSALGRAPTGSTLELFGGMPVVPELGPRGFDWLVGARAGQHLFGERLGAGVSYLHRRDAGQLDDEEVGADLTATPLPWATLSAVGAFDLVYDGLAEARVNAVAHDERDRIELFASRRIASRLLPATSLFSVIGATPSSELGADATWNAFPRLDVGGALALEALGDALGYRAALRTTLRFSDVDGGQLQLEATRRNLRAEGWTGARVTSEWPFTRRMRGHASLELAFADHPGDRGGVWPWARAGASYDLAERWLLAAGVGLRASPELAYDFNAIARVSYRAEWWP